MLRIGNTYYALYISAIIVLIKSVKSDFAISIKLNTQESLSSSLSSLFHKFSMEVTFRYNVNKQKIPSFAYEKSFINVLLSLSIPQ